MQDSVEQLRLRWTPELTAAAVRRLQGHPSDVKIPTIDRDGEACLDLRGITVPGMLIASWTKKIMYR